jgi:hypothetical protein
MILVNRVSIILDWPRMSSPRWRLRTTDALRATSNRRAWSECKSTRSMISPSALQTGIRIGVGVRIEFGADYV